MLIRQGDTKIPLTLKFKLNETNIEFETKLYLFTNASTFAIPVYAYNGKLQVRSVCIFVLNTTSHCVTSTAVFQTVVHRPELFRGQLDFGTVEMSTPHSLLFTLRNNNPLNVSLFSTVAGPAAPVLTRVFVRPCRCTSSAIASTTRRVRCICAASRRGTARRCAATSRSRSSSTAP